MSPSEVKTCPNTGEVAEWSSSGLLNRRSALKRYRGFESLPPPEYSISRLQRCAGVVIQPSTRAR